MDRTYSRRAIIGSVLGLAGLSTAAPPVRSLLDRFAPGSGDAWHAAEAGPASGTVESPYGSATVAYDDYGVPTIEAGDESALYFAVGYVQAADRFFQMDLQRRLMGGRLAEVVGEVALDSDEFHTKMDFRGAAAANLELLADDPVMELLEAYADGVNAARSREPTPHEVGLLSYEPRPWRPVDTMLLEKQIAWQLTGSFRTLRRALVRDRLGADAAETFYPERLDHDVPIIREAAGAVADDRPTETPPEPAPTDIGPGLVEWLSTFEAPPDVGSNSWVVSGAFTASGRPLLANDPHLGLLAPPVWYEMNLHTEAGMRTRGVTFPGVPFVIIGENHAGAWGFTNLGADVLDCYTYDLVDDGAAYRYGDGQRKFDTTTVTIPVSDAPDRSVTVTKSHHGPVLEREGRRVGVAWTGLTATATTRAIHAYSQSDGIADVRAATRDFDTPTQSLVYADREGNTLYAATGRLPIRRIDGEPVRGDRLFDGSTGEGEWAGFEPYGVSSWDGFVPFEAKPSVTNPDYIATANQRVVEDPDFYIAPAYSDPYRGARIYQRLDSRIARGEPLDMAFMRELQTDSHDRLAASLVPELLERAGDMIPAAWRRRLAEWDHRMDPDSRAALFFVRWLAQYREDRFASPLESAGLSMAYAPSDWVLDNLDADSRWFDAAGKTDAYRAAVERALETLASGSATTYGEYATTDTIAHPLEQAYLGYDGHPAAGSRRTVGNFAVGYGVGSSWRMLADLDGVSAGVVPGGNSGNPFSEHYQDQLALWADGRYRQLPRDPPGLEPTLRFRGAER